jgi:hypothetical protein
MEPKIEQKLVCYTESQSRHVDFLSDMFREGWKIVKISGSSHGTENMCWVLFERDRTEHLKD